MRKTKYTIDKVPLHPSTKLYTLKEAIASLQRGDSLLVVGHHPPSVKQKRPKSRPTPSGYVMSLFRSFNYTYAYTHVDQPSGFVRIWRT